MIGAGTFRQLAWARQQGVHRSLGMEWDDWVTQFVGGWVRMALEDRREAVQELTASEEDGGMGMSQREAADVLGVSDETVARDLGRRPTNVAPEPENLEEPGLDDATNVAPDLGRGANAPSEAEAEREVTPPDPTAAAPGQTTLEEIGASLIPDVDKAHRVLDQRLIMDLIDVRRDVERWADYLTEEHRTLLRQTAEEFAALATNRKKLEALK